MVHIYPTKYKRAFVKGYYPPLVSLDVSMETIQDKKQFGGGCHGTLGPTTHGYHKPDHNDLNYFLIITLVYAQPAAVQAPL